MSVDVLRPPHAEVGLRGIVPLRTLMNLGVVVPERNQGTFILPEPEMASDTFAHVIDASVSRPNVVVIERPVRGNGAIGREWFFGTIPGPAYGELLREQREEYVGRLKAVMSDANRVSEVEIAARLATLASDPVPLST